MPRRLLRKRMTVQTRWRTRKSLRRRVTTIKPRWRTRRSPPTWNGSRREHEEDEEAAATEEGEPKGEHEGVGADGDAEIPVSLMTLFSSLSPYRPVCLLLRTSSGSWPNRKMPQRRRMSLPSNGPLVKGQSDHSASEWLRGLHVVAALPRFESCCLAFAAP